jgi:hypothetical protein
MMINFHPVWATLTPNTRAFINEYAHEMCRSIEPGDGIVARLSNPSTMEYRQLTLISERGTYGQHWEPTIRIVLKPEIESTLPICIQRCHKEAEIFGWVCESVGGISRIAERIVHWNNVYDPAQIEQAIDEEINA